MLLVPTYGFPRNRADYWWRHRDLGMWYEKKRDVEAEELERQLGKNGTQKHGKQIHHKRNSTITSKI